jgi:hypothetical protein
MSTSARDYALSQSWDQVFEDAFAAYTTCTQQPQAA